jgi:hypothetical protein
MIAAAAEVAAWSRLKDDFGQFYCFDATLAEEDFDLFVVVIVVVVAAAAVVSSDFQFYCVSVRMADSDEAVKMSEDTEAVSKTRCTQVSFCWLKHNLMMLTSIGTKVE